MIEMTTFYMNILCLMIFLFVSRNIASDNFILPHRFILEHTFAKLQKMMEDIQVITECQIVTRNDIKLMLKNTEKTKEVVKARLSCGVGESSTPVEGEQLTDLKNKLFDNMGSIGEQLRKTEQ